MSPRPTIQTAIEPGVSADPRPARQISAEFRGRIAEGARLKPAGEAAADPERLLKAPYGARFRLEVFAAEMYLSNYRFDENLNFFVAFVGLRSKSGLPAKTFHPRIFYKDSSLVWRVATHFIREEDENWIGKGDVKWERIGDDEYLCSAEETANLPFEIQEALDLCSRAGTKPKRDDAAVPLVLRRGRGERIQPFADFATPRRKAMENYGVHGGRPIGSLRKEGEPESLRFAKGFEPDFAGGLVDESRSSSRLYGGQVRKFRILSKNRRVQHQFINAHRTAWMNPPQSVTTELSTYGVRTVDVPLDERAFVPGIEYHYLDDSTEPPELHSQIPAGFAGPATQVDPARADASAWTHRLPAVAEFRRWLRSR